MIVCLPWLIIYFLYIDCNKFYYTKLVIVKNKLKLIKINYKANKIIDKMKQGI